MKKMAMAVAFATLMAFTMVTMGCDKTETTPPTPVKTPAVTKTPVTSGTATRP
ncbi:MAG: hypothetical protein NTX50_18455 [Candidatus Sumerlaeota bacterium]|nr:hypothetical protein [Candidatus Sumerlaeota bacterium]